MRADEKPRNVFCEACNTYHHPKWHLRDWQEVMREEIKRAEIAGNGGRVARLKAVMHNGESNTPG